MVAGKRLSESFTTKAEARAWAASQKTDIMRGERGEIPNKSFGDLLEKYRDEVSISKAGEQWEKVRIGLMLRDDLALVKLDRLNSTHAAAWRDRRLREVSSGSVLREWNLLSNACRVAIREWRWLKENPFTQIRRPKPPPHRERLFSCAEIDAILAALGWNDGDAPDTVSRRVAYVLLWALETGMRCGEICALRPDDVSDTVALVRAEQIGAGKTMAARRRVPLMPFAREIASILKPGAGDTLFGVTVSQVDALFRKARDRCGIEGVTFHDSRANAATMLSRHLDILELARAIGHSDIKRLMIYYRKSAEDIAEGLNFK